MLALQYAGHGTTVPDLDGDEAVEDSRTGSLVDEAICPVDFAAGNLIVDDDLGEIWDLLPSGVSLTMFFDSCHSGGSQRELRPVPAPEPDALHQARAIAGELGTRYRLAPGRKLAVTEVTSTSVVESLTLVESWVELPRVVPAANGSPLIVSPSTCV